jgi:hypothetical protein
MSDMFLDIDKLVVNQRIPGSHMTIVAPTLMKCRMVTGFCTPAILILILYFSI